MNRFRSIVSAAALAVAIVLVPQAALAAGPATSPAVVHSETFDAATMPGLTLAPDLAAGSPSPAYWGRTVGSRHGLTGDGLWCAASVTAAPGLDGWTVFGGLFPVGTFGYATLDLPELADYYSTSLECS